MNLITNCPQCQKPTDERGRDGLCAFCLLDEVIQPLKTEYIRLWAKRARYSKARVNLRPVESQLAIVARRLGDKVHARISNPEQAIAMINGHLENARNIVEHPTMSRILLPKAGDLAREITRSEEPPLHPDRNRFPRPAYLA